MLAELAERRVLLVEAVRPDQRVPRRRRVRDPVQLASTTAIKAHVATRSHSQAVRRSTPSGTRALRASSVCAMAYSRSGSDGFGR